ncbi:rod shape-determining protein MreC [Flavobacterium pallidum]|uniref:Cell shape-determining protein MreC n=1 Tax=Flavobacterium pallidum TaxID=2172098 RepID=A0A2S1SGG1_9FLAO|nr:rod shape-determining protein MreC [Flavobacterium pallidum]AWI25475.1 rod shape-determining protein MreC [Flavobacterium pallidum]
MQQIFNFIFKNSYKLLFLLLLGISFSLTIQSHSYHKSKVISSANFLTGGVYERMNAISEYFNLKTRNEELAIENARLKSLLFNKADTTKTILPDTIKGVNKVNIVAVSKVIHNSFTMPENYLTLNSGSKEGIGVDMGVINDLGIVGLVEKTSAHYATVQSILNLNSKISAKIKKSNHFGTLSWNGKSTGYVQLTDVPRLAMIRKGDTIVTNSDSTIFPENIGIGTIYKIYTDDETNYYTLDVKLFNDMTNLGHVYIIDMKDKQEIQALQTKTQPAK